jgi:predicted RNA-binding protein with PUA domain
MAEYRWWCLGCGKYTEKAPCEHCSAGHEEVLVIDPGMHPPLSRADAELCYGSVLDYDWPEEAYRDVA